MKFTAFLIFLISCCHADEPLILKKAMTGFSNQAQPNEGLEDELVSMMDEDQAARQIDPKNVSKEERQRIGEIAAKHNIRLQEIVAEHGWPGIRLAGIKGSHAMWLLVQHQDHDLAFQKRCLLLLKSAVDRQDDQYQNYAYLVDRVRKNENRPQVYGTQWDFKEGKLRMFPVEDFANLNKRRLEAGLTTIEEYRDGFKAVLGFTDADLLLDPVKDIP